MCYVWSKLKLRYNVCVMCYLNFAFIWNQWLPVYKIYPAVHIMCFVFVIYIYILKYTNCKLTIFLFLQPNLQPKYYRNWLLKPYVLAAAEKLFCSPGRYVCCKSLNLMSPQYRCCLRQHLTTLKTLELWMPINGNNTGTAYPPLWLWPPPSHTSCIKPPPYQILPGRLRAWQILQPFAVEVRTIFLLGDDCVQYIHFS